MTDEFSSNATNVLISWRHYAGDTAAMTCGQSYAYLKRCMNHDQMIKMKVARILHWELNFNVVLDSQLCYIEQYEDVHSLRRRLLIMALHVKLKFRSRDFHT